ncbi:MAG: hypothetical protein ACLVAU_13715 [Ruminococcus sp.]
MANTRLLSGHKRYIALQKLEKKTILCRVCDFNDKEAFKAVCHANIQRKGENPTEICNMFNGYRQRFGEDMSVTEMSTFLEFHQKRYIGVSISIILLTSLSRWSIQVCCRYTQSR